MMHKDFQIIVIGGGHAGTEAAISASNIGCNVLLITNSIKTIGEMSCNPSIGGIGKGQLVKEIDALGGIMGLAADYSGIQFKKLNLSKGYAVHSTRVQSDRKFYKKFIINFLKKQKNIRILESEVVDIIIKKNQAYGVETKKGEKIFSDCVILTTGTFLNGAIYIGTKKFYGGRKNDFSSRVLANNLKKRNIFSIKRLKTGTPPRILAKSINFNCLEKQDGDFPIPKFSFLKNKKKFLPQVSCFITKTNLYTHKIIRENLKKSSMYSGIIQGIGPRYCPSLEDKIVKFSERESHQIFLEPEGINSEIIYPNGISNSMPIEIQKKIVKSIYGLEKSIICQPGYAVEYDFFDPKDLYLTLESKKISNLFFAGQINGTTGYEEAAAQGIVSGINAAKLSLNQEMWIPTRESSYIGVLVNDLCTLGTNEPYRMFTSRSEFRLYLREDNADFRLTEIGKKIGTVKENRWKQFCKKKEIFEKEKNRLKNIWIGPNKKNIKEIEKKLSFLVKKEVNGIQLLKRKELDYEKLTKIKNFSPSIKNKEIYKQIEIESKYEGYIKKNRNYTRNIFQYDRFLFPKKIDFLKISGLSKEAVEKFIKYKPNSIGQASRISGITPATITTLIIWMKKNNFIKSR
ncbi:tRNA uridine-5-carboxymethylaminomethyl(34) synthesis enzyme MnmG [bacterium endosymbiont of Pedicinus badii]|uniref:tRNA uridine-5-carboxymethylaminomethyl(34) synthesis enzyme MnmG n=1 Tax=bacterium endosymbiont of Pedicinus badii TaxID=1719126 RepID=UPI0011807653|nr:tRNA uridine-5-carboxymethylaminomethyl(34) synthesis enzyme MnmG [bacterium endosymbiont of Pedicinus badii]